MATNPFAQIGDALNQMLAKVIDGLHKTTKDDFVLWPPRPKEDDDGPVAGTADRGVLSFDDLVSGRSDGRVVPEDQAVAEGSTPDLVWHPRPDRQDTQEPSMDEVKDASDA